MGKTNPTYRDQLRQFEADWEPFRKALRRQYVDHWDQLFDEARGFADAGGLQNPRDARIAILLSICLAQEKRIADLEHRLEVLAVEAPETGGV